MKQYLTEDHVNLLNENLRYFPKYENFKLSEISKLIAENDENYKGWTYLFSKFSSVHDNIFSELLYNGFIEFIDWEKGICKFTSDGHKLKDFGDYKNYLNYLNLDYSAKRQENIVKKYWWVWTVIAFLTGLFSNNFIEIIKLFGKCFCE